MSPLCQLDGVTGRQPTVVAAVAVPQSDEVSNGVRIGLLQAASRDDHGALCGYRCLIGKREHLRCRRERADCARSQGGERARGPDRMVWWSWDCCGADRARGRAAIAMAVCGHAGCWIAG